MGRRAKCANCYVCDKAKCPMDRAQAQARSGIAAKQGGEADESEGQQTERGEPTCDHDDQRDGER